MVYQGEAFCPGHVTAFFEVCDHPDPRRKGSRGAGLCLTLGVQTLARVREASRSSLEIFVNGSRTESDVIAHAAASILKGRTYDVKVLSTSQLPTSQGFGTSSAAALSTLLALDDALGLGTPRDDLVTAAHVAEVACGTGLGDVVPASMGGMDVRVEPGAPGYARTRKINVKRELLLAILGPEVPTRSILRDPDKLASINRAGASCLKDFAGAPSFERLLDLGSRFAEESGLASRSILEVMGASRMYGHATMAMLGNSIFASGNRTQLSALYRKYGIVLRCDTDNEGARFV